VKTLGVEAERVDYRGLAQVLCQGVARAKGPFGGSRSGPARTRASSPTTSRARTSCGGRPRPRTGSSGCCARVWLSGSPA
jgi:hypothetical protein